MRALANAHETHVVLVSTRLHNGTYAGLPSSGMTAGQLRQKRVKRMGTAAAAVGVILGCILGMVSLLFIDLDRAVSSRTPMSPSHLRVDSGLQKCMIIKFK